jgi:hypothetical protein
VGVLDRVAGQHGNQGVGGDVGGAFLPDFPTHPAVHFDPDLRHRSLRSYAQTMGHIGPSVNGYFA